MTSAETIDPRLQFAGLGAAAALVAIGLCFIQALNGFIWPDAFFDARVFGRAIEAIRAGHGPYDLIYGPTPDLQHLPLVQPPPIAWLLTLIAGAPISVAALDLFVSAFVVIGVGASAVYSARLFFERDGWAFWLALGVFASLVCGSGMMALVTGNVSGLLWGAIFTALYASLRDKSWRLFHLVVFVATLFKPFFLTLWIIPVLVQGWSWRQFWIAAAWAGGAAALYALSFVALPELTQAWFAVLNSRLGVGDVGGGLFPLVRTSVGVEAALAAHVVFVLLLGASLLASRVEGRARLAALLILAIIANPRMNAYDYCYAAIPAFFVAQSVLTDLAGRVRGQMISIAGALGVALASTVLFLWSQRWTNLFLAAALGGAILAATQWPRLRAAWIKP